MQISSSDGAFAMAFVDVGLGWAKYLVSAGYPPSPSSTPTHFSSPFEFRASAKHTGAAAVVQYDLGPALGGGNFASHCAVNVPCSLSKPHLAPAAGRAIRCQKRTL